MSIISTASCETGTDQKGKEVTIMQSVKKIANTLIKNKLMLNVNGTEEAPQALLTGIISN